MTEQNPQNRENETQQGPSTESEPVNRPDRSVNPNRQQERERGAEDAHFGDGQGQSDRPNQGDLRTSK